MSKQTSDLSRARIFKAIKDAAPTVELDKQSIEQEALELLNESEFARPKPLSNNASDALMMRINAGAVIGTTCEKIASLQELPNSVRQFLAKHHLSAQLKVQEIAQLTRLDWQDMVVNVDIQDDNSVGLCMAEYGVAETGSFVVHSSPDMPILLNFLPLYLLAVIPESKVLHNMDEYALIANEIAKQGKTPRNMCLISGVSGTTDIEGVLVQGAHGPEILHIIIVGDQ
jgi:L-lactate dehydrogenase complex protein LldG